MLDMEAASARRLLNAIIQALLVANSPEPIVPSSEAQAKRIAYLRHEASKYQRLRYGSWEVGWL